MPIQVEMPDPLGISQTGTSNDVDVVSLPVAFGQGDTDGRTMRVIIAGDSVASVSAGNTLDVRQVSGANWSVIATATDLDIRDLVNATDSMSVYQVSGANWSVEVASQPSTFDVRQVSGSIDSVRVDNASIPVTKSGSWSIDNPVGQGDAATALRVVVAGNSDASVTATQVGTWTVGLSAGVNNIGDVDVLTLPNVTLAAGTNTNEVVGDVAHDAVSAGNPILIAGIAEDVATTAPANRVSAEGDATRILTNRDGAVYVLPHGPQYWDYHENSSSALTDAVVKAAPGAGLSLYVTDIVCSTGAATALNIFFEEGATTVLGPWYLEAVSGRGLHIKFGTPKKITANTALTVTTSAAIAHSIDVTGYVAPG